MGLSNWWYYTGSATKAITITGIIAIALLATVIASPHVKPLQPIAKSLGLIQTQVQTVYVPVNHTVVKYVNQTVVKYVNQTVPVYVNRTVYVYVGNASLAPIVAMAGKCAGDLVILPNNTAWFVFAWLIPKEYLVGNPVLYRALVANGIPPIYYNSTNHYAQLYGLLDTAFFGLSPKPMSLYTYNACYLDNVTFNGYYIAICGDTTGGGPFAVSAGEFPPAGIINVSGIYYQRITLLQFSDQPAFVGSQLILSNRTYSNATLVIPSVNTTYTGVMFIYGGVTVGRNLGYPLSTLGPACNITVIYAPNPQAALYITLPQEYINYWRESVNTIWGYYNPNDVYMGYWVWNYPS
ncbi:hypothetical protein [Vulcanisaeta distributa]|uniref:Uncharacterized protein n=1 Tax=Vulcanisaeta distributa (strain DSM 14429 / JCM 11212 / NBRC 100878 / IC-017) TaxID=572478 RepID=E1QUV9_VULDI|nr:hypothetical protein [Vulcanisaeta distributa]ADN49962.1 hypothetical protein Vdis_0565 [Vulcanisaeta distributa DSM 14429]